MGGARGRPVCSTSSVTIAICGAARCGRAKAAGGRLCRCRPGSLRVLASSSPGYESCRRAETALRDSASDGTQQAAPAAPARRLWPRCGRCDGSVRLSPSPARAAARAVSVTRAAWGRQPPQRGPAPRPEPHLRQRKDAVLGHPLPVKMLPKESLALAALEVHFACFQSVVRLADMPMDGRSGRRSRQECIMRARSSTAGRRSPRASRKPSSAHK